MGKRGVESVWLICKRCRHHGVAPDDAVGRYRCGKCGSADYSLTVNDPTKPVRLAMHNSGPHGADIRLPDAPIDEDAARKAGQYP